MAANPVFVGTPKWAQTSSGTSANTATDGSGTIVHLLTAGTQGSRIDSIQVWHRGANPASVLRFFLNTGGGYGLIQEANILTLATLSQTDASIPIILKPNLVIPANSYVGITVGTALTTGVQVSAEYGDF